MTTEPPTIGFDDKLELVRRRLAPADSVPLPPTREHRAAAVLLPLTVRDGEMALLYTRRNDRMKTHAGQVAFPGGRLDRSDQDLVSAALRETYEEVGIHPAKIHVLGSFPGRRTLQTNIMVTPFVGAISDGAETEPDPKEVAEIFYVPLAALRDRRYRTKVEPAGSTRLGQLPAIIYEGQTIWGLTYYLTLSFLGLIADTGL
ncbi:MAG TPA: CoA pyrophosphatase [Candidatus Binataceae bacterium]|nr:CoA pyrophosphatase [Candidatus Binataceae bacterium]